MFTYKELKNQRLGQLNILKIRQAYLTQKVSNDEIVYLTELTYTNLRIKQWYEK